MPIVNRLAEFHDDIVAWRRDLHRHPEILYEIHRTAAMLAEKLRSFDVDEVATGIGRTGVSVVRASLAIGLSIFAIAADTPHSVASDSFSGLVDVGGGRRMYLECRGNGSPTVVLVSGKG